MKLPYDSHSSLLAKHQQRHKLFLTRKQKPLNVDVERLLFSNK